MTASATIHAFPTPTPQSPRFEPRDRNAIVGAAMALSPSWAASFYLDDNGAELGSIGPFSAGEDVHAMSQGALGA